MAVEIRLLERADDRQEFRSGDEALDLYFHRFAGQNQFRHHVGVSYVAVEGTGILGFVTVSPTSLDAGDLPSGRKMLHLLRGSCESQELTPFDLQREPESPSEGEILLRLAPYERTKM